MKNTGEKGPLYIKKKLQNVSLYDEFVSTSKTERVQQILKDQAFDVIVIVVGCSGMVKDSFQLEEVRPFPKTFYINTNKDHIPKHAQGEYRIVKTAPRGLRKLMNSFKIPKT